MKLIPLVWDRCWCFDWCFVNPASHRTEKKSNIEHFVLSTYINASVYQIILSLMSVYGSPFSLTSVHTLTHAAFAPYVFCSRILNSWLLWAHCCCRGHVWATGHAWFNDILWRDLNTQPVVTQHERKLEMSLLHILTFSKFNLRALLKNIWLSLWFIWPYFTFLFPQ